MHLKCMIADKNQESPETLLTRKEGDGVGFQSPPVAGGEHLNQIGDARELISGEGVGNNEYPPVRTSVIKELDRKSDKIVPVSGHQAAFVFGGEIQLLFVRYLTHPNLMGTDSVGAALSEKDSNLGADVLIEVEFHEETLMKG
jgi:hypothetical protein